MWSVAELHPREAARAVTNLTRLGFATFNPCYTVRRIVRHKLRLEPRQVFPGYLFVAIADSQRWSVIHHCYGVRRLLTRQSEATEYREPCPIPDDFIKQVQACSYQDEEHKCLCLKPGTTVTVAKGPFRGHRGIVQWSDSARCRLLLHLLQRDVPITLAVEDVAAIDP